MFSALPAQSQLLTTNLETSGPGIWIEHAFPLQNIGIANKVAIALRSTGCRLTNAQVNRLPSARRSEVKASPIALPPPECVGLSMCPSGEAGGACNGDMRTPQSANGLMSATAARHGSVTLSALDSHGELGPES